MDRFCILREEIYFCSLLLRKSQNTGGNIDHIGRSSLHRCGTRDTTSVEEGTGLCRLKGDYLCHYNTRILRYARMLLCSRSIDVALL